LRELTSDLASLLRAALAHLTDSRAPSPKVIDLLPSAVHERIGVSLKVSVRGGLDEFLLRPRGTDDYPEATLSQELFLSAGAFATLGGRAGVHWVVEYDMAWEGLSKKIPGVSWRLGKNDSVDLVHVRMESLSGPKILLSEVSPSPRGDDADLEFVELYNPGFAEERLEGWALIDAGGRRFVLPPDARIPAGGTLLLARSAAPFFLRYGAVPAVSSLTLALNDEGDRVQLVNDRGMVSDEVSWGTFTQGELRVRAEQTVARGLAARPPSALPGSALVYTGSQNDFFVGDPTPGQLPG